MSQYLSSFLPNKIVVEAENWPYVEGAARTIIPISINEVAANARIDDLTGQTDYITTLIKSAVMIFEDYTNTSIIQQNWITYRNNFNDVGVFEMRRAKFVSLTSFQYLVNGTLTTISNSLYYVVTSNPPYAIIRLKPDQQWPSDIDYVEQAIKIQFVAGLSATAADVPADIKTCLYHLVTWLYDNRGNNDIAGMPSKGTGSEGAGLNALPNHSLDVIMKYRVQDVFGGFFVNIV
jgi:uncharacterized phiE125 gp8 family phage protein